MCYGKPDELLRVVIGRRPLPKNDLGHTPLDDFDHFCAYTGCDANELSARAFAFVKLAYVTASLTCRRFQYPQMDESLQKQCENIGMLLRDYPAGTSADLAEYCVLYWDGDTLAGAHLSSDQPGIVDEPFDVPEMLPEIPEIVDDWLKAPTFSFRPSLLEWLKDAPPYESVV